jgi:hypothetical protein
MAKIVTLQGEYFTWKNGHGHTSLDALGLTRFPDSFYLRSHRTGEVKLFLPDTVTMTENEFFDGEAQAYFVPAGNIRVQIWH